MGKEYTLREAANKLGIPYNNAKVIYRVYRQEGRTKGTPKHLKRMVARFKASPEKLSELGSDPRANELKAFLDIKQETQDLDQSAQFDKINPDAVLELKYTPPIAEDIQMCAPIAHAE